MTEFIPNPNQSERKEKFFSVDVNRNDLVTFEDIEYACEIVERFIQANSEVNPYETRVYARLQDAIYTLIGNAKDTISEVSELNSKIVNQQETIDDLNEVCAENEQEIIDLKNEIALNRVEISNWKEIKDNHLETVKCNEKKIDSLYIEIENYKNKIETLENELEKADTEISELNSRIIDIEYEIDDRNNFIYALGGANASLISELQKEIEFYKKQTIEARSIFKSGFEMLFNNNQ